MSNWCCFVTMPPPLLGSKSFVGLISSYYSFEISWQVSILNYGLSGFSGMCYCKFISESCWIKPSSCWAVKFWSISFQLVISLKNTSCFISNKFARRFGSTTNIDSSNFLHYLEMFLGQFMLRVMMFSKVCYIFLLVNGLNPPIISQSITPQLQISHSIE